MRHKASGEDGCGQFIDIERAARKQKRRQQEEKKNCEGIEEEEEDAAEERQQTAAMRSPRSPTRRASQQPAMLTLIGGSRHGNNQDWCLISQVSRAYALSIRCRVLITLVRIRLACICLFFPDLK